MCVSERGSTRYIAKSCIMLCERGTGFGFISDWMTKWREIFKPITRVTTFLVVVMSASMLRQLSSPSGQTKYIYSIFAVREIEGLQSNTSVTCFFFLFTVPFAQILGQNVHHAYQM